MSYYSKIKKQKLFQVILKYVAPGQEVIVIQDACKKLSFTPNDCAHQLTKEKLLKSVPGLTA